MDLIGYSGGRIFWRRVCARPSHRLRVWPRLRARLMREVLGARAAGGCEAAGGREATAGVDEVQDSGVGLRRLDRGRAEPVAHVPPRPGLQQRACHLSVAVARGRVQGHRSVERLRVVRVCAQRQQRPHFRGVVAARRAPQLCRACGVLRAGGRAGGVEGVTEAPAAGEDVELARVDIAVHVAVDSLAEHGERGWHGQVWKGVLQRAREARPRHLVVAREVVCPELLRVGGRDAMRDDDALCDSVSVPAYVQFVHKQDHEGVDIIKTSVHVGHLVADVANRGADLLY
mmetsp:Transcript_22677/g.47607  ORF Transcript_22677/g.47607 Transcript_22677/m.47607 type:complete len:287 (-) Transcript_22677:274-1134(-)